MPRYRFANPIDYWNGINYNLLSLADDIRFVTRYEDALSEPGEVTEAMARRFGLIRTSAELVIPERHAQRMRDRHRSRADEYLEESVFDRGGYYQERRYLDEFTESDLDFVEHWVDLDVVDRLDYGGYLHTDPATLRAGRGEAPSVDGWWHPAETTTPATTLSPATRPGYLTMGQEPAEEHPPARVLAYVGRNRVEDNMEGVDAVVDDRGVLPWDLVRELDRCDELVVLDPLSFPFEHLAQRHWDLPMAISLPADGDLHRVLTAPVLGRLSFFDRVAMPPGEPWERLRRSLGWAEGQRADPDAEDPAQRLPRWQPDDDSMDMGEGYDSTSYWTSRGRRLAVSAPAQAVCSIRHDLRANKAMHRLQEGALSPVLDAARDRVPPGSRLQVVEVGCGVGRWATLFDPARDRYTGLDVSPAMVDAAAANFPEHSFSTIEENLDLGLGDEGFDVAFTVTVLHHNRPEVRRRLIRQMWRAVRPGGMLAFLEDVVGSRLSPRGTTYPMAIGDLVSDIIEGCRGALVLEHVEALRYPHDDFHRAALVAVAKLGVPKKW
jgi:SAM-dependent methyltransferase